MKKKMSGFKPNCESITRGRRPDPLQVLSAGKDFRRQADLRDVVLKIQSDSG